MYLKKLEIQGFKSFAPKTTLEFSSGVTAIVGPNGSGKSNFTEAIRWVMGEQSMKTLRGKKSEDIIFAGSKNKPRMGMAQVSMYLDNTDHAMPIDYSEVVITRKLFRNGESEYYINKNRVRLLDVHELLAKTGFGQKTYSVIGQGMIDAFLKAGPKERKELFEEAAGVKQYQIKRNSSLNKLTQTKNNLLRISDLVQEIEPRLRSLKRQANRAQKKEEVEQILRDISKKYFNHAWNKLKSNFELNSSDLSTFRDEEKNILKNIEKLKKELANENARYDMRNKRKQQEKLNNLFDQKSKLNEEFIVLSGKIQVMEERDFSLNLNDKIRLLKNEVFQLDSDILKLKDEKEKLKKELSGEIKKQSDILFKIKNYQQKLSTLKSGVLMPSLSLKEVQKDLEALFKDESGLLEKVNACSDLGELDKLKQNIFDLHFDMEKILSKIKKAAKSESANIQKQLLDLQDNLSNFFGDRDSIAVKINNVKVQIAVLDTKQKSAEQQRDLRKIEIDNLGKELTSNLKKDKQIELNRLEIKKKGLDNKLHDIDKGIGAVQRELEEEIRQEQKRRDMFIDLEEQYRKKQDILNHVRDEIRKVEIKKAGVDAEKNVLLEEIKENFGCEDIDRITANFERSPIKLQNEETLRIEMNKYKKKQMAIGEIDPQVIAEFEQVKKRYNFLTSQREDLEKAIKSLKIIILKLDKTINKKFDDSFKKINGQFQKYFEILFNGGKAKLLKYRPKIAAINKSGEKEIKLSQEFYIDIKATPPGKKLRDLNMLSGGERALTSIALILAIISTNPAPFIVLDEVDAALDEANTSRYAKIVEDVAKKSQFIVVTHNRETMKCAKVLYGVTMGDDGVSKLLSMRMEEDIAGKFQITNNKLQTGPPCLSCLTGRQAAGRQIPNYK